MKDFDHLKEYIARTRNFDVAVMQQQFETAVEERMRDHSTSSVSAYIDHLEVAPDEFTTLLNLALGPRNAFFKDNDWWTATAETLETHIRSKKAPLDSLRCWSINCGSGQEAYSLAMTLCETLGTRFFQDKVKIFATDNDESLLQVARLASYSPHEMDSVTSDLQEKYFVPNAEQQTFKKELRRALIFGKQSVLTDPAITRIDLILCRHVLVFYNLEQQRKLLSRLRFSLGEDGLLLLGAGEFIPAGAGYHCIHAGIYGKENETLVNPLLANLAATEPEDKDGGSTKLYESAFDGSPVAQLALDSSGVLSAANAKARASFGLVAQDIGRPFQDLEVSYRPVELRSLIDIASKEFRLVVANRALRHQPSGRTQLFDVYVQPVADEGNKIGFTIQFNDVTELYELQDELLSVNQQLQTANEELQSAHEELETTNEELQSTNEELETTNEELQSTNEELETMNEELRSTNLELETANRAQRSLALTVEQTNTFLQTILASMKCGVVVINSEYKVTVWNDYCRDLWGLRSDEVVGHCFFDLDIGLPVTKLKAPLHTFVQLKKDYEELVVDSINRRGRPVRCVIRVTPLLGTSQTGSVLLIEDHGLE